MSCFMTRAKGLLISEDGPTSVEYAFMLALIVVAAFGAITGLGTKVSGVFAGMDAKMTVPS